MIFRAFSKAMYSTWIYYNPLKTLFDCGEGVNIHLEGQLIAVRNILISHGHSDHLTGLQNILVTKLRHYYTTKEFLPLSVFYPLEDLSIRRYLEYLFKIYEREFSRLPIQMIGLQEGEIVELPAKRKYLLEAFRVEHSDNISSLGYHIIEVRKKLKTEFTQLTQNQIKDLVQKQGKESLTFEQEKHFITYSGDTRVLSSKTAKPVDYLMHECTFLREEEKENQFHSSMEEVLSLASEIQPETLILYHFSSRYTRREIDYRLKKLGQDKDLENIKIHIVYPDAEFRID